MPDPNPITSWYPCRGLGKRYPHTIREYNTATVIVIRPLIQPRTCKMGSSIFSAMIGITFASTTRESFPIMPLKEITNREFFYVASGNDYRAFTYLFSPPSQEQFNWLLLVGVTVRVLESDINGGVSLTLPEYPDEEVSSSLLTTPPVAYLLL